MPTETKSARTIFLDALERPEAADRDRFIDSACGLDEALRAEVVRLLGAHGDLNDFMDRPAAGFSPMIGWSASAQVGTTIGRYKLLEQIGEGGMGVVYVAEQTEPIRRRVALKIIKPGMDTRQVIARFEAERQALAMMDHPNIAKVLDGGTTDHVGQASPDIHNRQAEPGLHTPPGSSLQAPSSGRPYFVMELVRGMPITEYCDQAQVDIRGRLDLFMTVCHAVQHAHQKGIIHRDIKPSNVLVTMHDDKPVVKVIDFGVAKAIAQNLTERTIYTAFTEMIGTPLYMSPEQAGLSGLDVDTRSDVYSLGVLLYELLTGHTPFDRDTLVEAGLDEVRRMIREDEPPRPSYRISTLKADAGSTISERRGIDQRQLSRSLHGELDWIVMKALEKDRNRRYESASAFAADTERYLNHEPVEAGPPSVIYRIRKFVRRNRVAILSGSLVAMVMIGGTAASVWQAVRASDAQRQSDERYRLARRAVDEMYTQVAEKWLAAHGDLTDLQREFLEKALIFYEQFATERAGDHQARYEAVLAQNRVANIQWSLAEFETAWTAQRKALEEIEELSADNPGDLDYLRELAMTLHYSALKSRERNQVGASETFHKRALSIWESLLRGQPESQEYRHQSTSVQLNLAETYKRVGRNGEAEHLYIRARDEYQRLHDESPKNDEFTGALGTAENSLGILLNQTGRRVEGQEAIRRALSLAEQIGDREASNAAVAQRLVSLANFIDNKEERINYYRRAIDIINTLLEERPKSRAYLERLQVTEANLATVLFEAGKQTQGEEMAQSALESAKRLATGFPDHADYQVHLARSDLELTKRMWMKGERNEAENRLRHQEQILKKVWARNPDRVEYIQRFCEHYRLRAELLLQPHANRGVTDVDANIALQCLQQAVILDPKNQSNWLWLGVARYLSGDWNGAIDAVEKCIELHGGGGWQFHHLLLALAHARHGDKEKALEWYMKSALNGSTDAVGDTPQWLVNEAAAAFAYPAAEPVKYWEDTRNQRMATLGPNHPYTRRATFILAHRYFAANRTDDAISMLEELYVADPSDTQLLLMVAALQAWFERESSWEAACMRAIRHTQDTKNLYTAERTAKICSLRPTSNREQLEVALNLARQAVNIDRGAAWTQLTLGMAAYRNGNYEESEQTCMAASKLTDNLRVVGTAAFYRAMSLFRLGRESEARLLANEATRLIPLPADEENPVAGIGADPDILILWVAFREARDLIVLENAHP